MITINQVELASNLADRELRKTFEGIIDRYDEDDKCTYYTHEAQYKFNELYDEFYDMIEACEDAPFLYSIE